MSRFEVLPVRSSDVRRPTVILLVALIAIVTGLGIWWISRTNKEQTAFEEIRRALKQRRLAEAEKMARQWLATHPRDVDAMIVLGEALQRQGDISGALDIYLGIPQEAGESAISARLASVSILLHEGRLADADSILRQINSNPAYNSVTDELWVTLLSLSGRRWESMPYLQRCLSSTSDPFSKLVYLANPDNMPAPPTDVFARMYKVRDPLGAIGCGRVAASLGRTELATTLAEECIAKRPEIIEAHVLKGLILLDSGDLNAFDNWLQSLAQSADEHPSTWFLRGRREQEAGHRPEAIRCYWEVLRRQPNHDLATYQIGQLLAAESRIEMANVFLERSKRLTRLIELVIRMIKDPGSESDYVECARLVYELGRLHECQAWCQLTLVIYPNSAETLDLVDTLRNELRADTPWLLPSADLASRFDLSSYPAPKRPSERTSPRSPIPSQTSETSQIWFVDDAARLGLKFVYFNGDDPSSEGKRMFEYTGGGVAAFDYDRDGWCDVYFTQGTTWPPTPSNLQYLDVLYRNISGQQFSDVTIQAGISDPGFGQGISSGDYDNDGFPDLYVANIDGNRLYRNNGDGTFSDVTGASGLGKHPHWTTSCLIADLNGDSLPDVYDVTFLEGDDIFTRICRDADGRARSCAPAGFPAAPDHVYMNQSDGTFREMTGEWGFDAPNGDGLGIVAADFDDSGTISVFIANDGRPNHFYVFEQEDKHWHEVGVLSGLAYNDSGSAQASMGVGAGDVNNDGRLDLYITSFYNEADSVYINLGPRMFSDRSRSLGIHEPSWSILGFGMQFIDADRDGWEDLILVNGHVDDFTHKQIPYKMRPQFYRNLRTRFSERFAKDLGPFFDEPRLGRGLARVDWNRDGLNEVAVSHIGDPAALLTNRSQNAGRGLGLKLIGTTRSRDAIGTKVTVTAGKTTLTRQLTGGDGYQATNERRLEFGLADHQGDVEIQIQWMGGAVETFQQIPADCEYVAIEGRGKLLRLQPDIAE